MDELAKGVDVLSTAESDLPVRKRSIASVGQRAGSATWRRAYAGIWAARLSSCVGCAS